MVETQQIFSLKLLQMIDKYWSEHKLQYLHEVNIELLWP